MKEVLFFVFILVLHVSETDAQSYPLQKEDVPEIVFSVDFSKDTVGIYSSDDVKKDFENIKWVLTKKRAEIKKEEGRGNVLRVSYPKGSLGSHEGGIQFVRELPERNEYYLDYYIKAEEGFDFRKGGKLPGLTSGGEKYTGGFHPEHGEGWSARYMWVKDGYLIVYLYYVDMKGKYGDHIDLKNCRLEPGKWHRLTQHIVLNTDNKKNGWIQVWFDEKKVVDERRVRLRLNNLGLIDAFYFSTFHGGSSLGWVPENDSFMRFDNITVSKAAPDFMK
jgi:hypothetical protein